MFCPNCGNKIDNNDKFCRSCGNSMLKIDTEVVDENNVNSQEETAVAQPPYCTNCGKSVGSLKTCPYCHFNTKKSYERFCKYCGGNIVDKKCAGCGTHAKTTFVENSARVFIVLIFGIFYFSAFSCLYTQQTLAGFLLFTVTFILNLFLFRKKQIYKIRLKVLKKKNRKLRLACTYISIPLILILSLIPIALIVTTPSVENSEAQSIAISYSENLLRNALKNPDSLKVQNAIVKDYYIDEKDKSFSMDDLKYVYVIIDYSAQNGFGGYNRDTMKFYLVLDAWNNVKQISSNEFYKNK